MGAGALKWHKEEKKKKMKNGGKPIDFYSFYCRVLFVQFSTQISRFIMHLLQTWARILSTHKRNIKQQEQPEDYDDEDNKKGERKE